MAAIFGNWARRVVVSAFSHVATQLTYVRYRSRTVESPIGVNFGEDQCTYAGAAFNSWAAAASRVSTAPTSPKVRAFVPPGSRIDDHTGSTPEDAEALLVRGLATLETVDGVTDEYLAAARRSMDESQLAEFERNVRDPDGRLA